MFLNGFRQTARRPRLRSRVTKASCLWLWGSGIRHPRDTPKRSLIVMDPIEKPLFFKGLYRANFARYKYYDFQGFRSIRWLSCDEMARDIPAGMIYTLNRP